jgi:hypothetical protein
LEFFDIGGDPAELIAFMVKNPWLVPGMKSLKAGMWGREGRDGGDYGGVLEVLWRCG